MSDEIENNEGGLSRRSMMKRAGIGAAAVWAAPVVSSVGLSAAAASGVDAVTCNGCTAGGDVCGGQGECEGTCPCSPLLDGTCRCWGPAHGGCDSFMGRCDPAGPNNGDGDCPSGSSCVPTCCYSGGKTGVCVPPCGAPGGASFGAGDGPRTDGA